MRIAFHLIGFFASLICMMISLNLGLDWLDMEIGYGLNPYIAFPLAAFCAIGAIAYMLTLIQFLNERNSPWHGSYSRSSR